jgi:AcrR family transcriptional regulator
MTADTITDARSGPRGGDRERTLDAAGELLAMRGLAALSLDAVARRTGTSTARIRRWWPSEEALALDALRHEWIGLAAHVRRSACRFGLRPPGEPPGGEEQPDDESEIDARARQSLLETRN